VPISVLAVTKCAIGFRFIGLRRRNTDRRGDRIGYSRRLMRLADETSAIKTEAASDCALIGRSEFQNAKTLCSVAFSTFL
jgi:hypothetical protein